MQVLRRAQYVLVPWKNGAGSSLEVASGGPPGGPFDWRVSIAQVERSGRFSDYGGYERTTALVEGAGFTLRAEGAATLRFSQPGDCHAYAGSVPYSCELHAGPSWDLNLIARAGIGASMRIVGAGAGGIDIAAEPATRYVLPLSGQLSVRADGSGALLGPWDAAVLGEGESCRVLAVEPADRATVALVGVPGSCSR
jgi:environmental stress-induced protein Ves